MTAAASEPLRLAIVSAGTSEPSSTSLLAQRTADSAAAVARSHGRVLTTTSIELRALATDIASGLVTQLITPKVRQAASILGEADGIVAATPVYKAGPSGLFTSFCDLLDDDLLIARPVVLAATAGTARHALVADDQLRSLFAYFRALTTPTALFAAPEDWQDPALTRRIERAAVELVALMESGVAAAVRGQSWHSYQHEFGGDNGAEVAIDLDSDLMRLATGGSAA